jgi:hypothetical protein
MRRVLSQILLPTLSKRFPGRGLVAAEPPEPCAVFPGIHSGIRRVAIYEDCNELILCVDDLTHGHFAEYTEGLSDEERVARVVNSVVDFLGALFADQVVVWGQPHVGGGWYRPDLGASEDPSGVPKFLWSGPRA